MEEIRRRQSSTRSLWQVWSGAATVFGDAFQGPPGSSQVLCSWCRVFLRLHVCWACYPRGTGPLVHSARMEGLSVLGHIFLGSLILLMLPSVQTWSAGGLRLISIVQFVSTCTTAAAMVGCQPSSCWLAVLLSRCSSLFGQPLGFSVMPHKVHPTPTHRVFSWVESLPFLVAQVAFTGSAQISGPLTADGSLDQDEGSEMEFSGDNAHVIGGKGMNARGKMKFQGGSCAFKSNFKMSGRMDVGSGSAVSFDADADADGETEFNFGGLGLGLQVSIITPGLCVGGLHGSCQLLTAVHTYDEICVPSVPQIVFYVILCPVLFKPIPLLPGVLRIVSSIAVGGRICTVCLANSEHTPVAVVR